MDLKIVYLKLIIFLSCLATIGVVVAQVLISDKKVQNSIDLDDIVGKWRCEFSMANSHINAVDEYNKDGSYFSTSSGEIKYENQVIEYKAKIKSTWRVGKDNNIYYDDIQLLDIESNNQAYKETSIKTYQQIKSTVSQIHHLSKHRFISHMIQPFVLNETMNCEK